MADVNVWTGIGRLTRDPEYHEFQGGGGVCNLGLATLGQRKHDQASGEWKDDPLFIDVKVFDRKENDNRKLGTRCMDRLSKGTQVYVRGHLVIERWTPAGGGDERSVIRVVADDIQFLEPARDGRGAPQQGQGQQGAAQRPQQGSGQSRQGNGQQGRQGGQQRAPQGQQRPAPQQQRGDAYDEGGYDEGAAWTPPAQARGQRPAQQPPADDDIPF